LPTVFGSPCSAEAVVVAINWRSCQTQQRYSARSNDMQSCRYCYKRQTSWSI